MRPEWERQFDGWEERCRATALFSALNGLSQMRISGLDFQALGLVVLTFILNCMLDGQRCTEQDVLDHLREVLGERLGSALSEEELLGAWRALRDRLQNSGEQFNFVFPDLRPQKEPGETLTVRFTLIDSFLQPDGTESGRAICLRLSTDGLDLLFKMKELHRELGISIAQMLFRQQIHRGTFDGALNALRELSLEVQHRKDHIQQLNQRIYRAVETVSHRVVDEMWQGVLELARREQAVFAEIRTLVGDTRRQIEEHARSQKERDHLAKLSEIELRLTRVIDEHSHIISVASSTTKGHIDALERAMARTFVTALHLGSEVMDPVARGEASPANLVYAVRSLCRPHLPARFTPLRAFEPQRIQNQSSVDTGGGVPELSEDEKVSLEAAELQLRRAQVDELASVLAPVLDRAMMTEDDVTLSVVLADLPAEVRNRLLGDWRFHYVLQLFHRFEVVDFAGLADVDPDILAGVEPELAAVSLLLQRHPEWLARCQGFHLHSVPGTQIPIPDGGYISDMRFERWSASGPLL